MLIPAIALFFEQSNKIKAELKKILSVATKATNFS
jgi:hypothetical protein